MRLAALLPIVLLLTACASTPRRQYAQVNDSFIAGVELLISARQTGAFKDKEWNETIVPLIELGDSLLDQYDAASKSGIKTGNLVALVRDVLLKLGPYITRASNQFGEGS